MNNRGYLCVSLLFISCLLHNVAGDLTANIFLRLYHRNGSFDDVNVRNASQLVPQLDINQTTVIFIHGFTENVTYEDVLLVTGAYLNYTSLNVLALDYGQVAQQFYTVSVGLYTEVGKLLAEGVNGMIAAGVSPSKLHLIGHSLGSQVAGIAGRNIVTKISRITGLDPAGPLFYIFNAHLSKDDAQFVDIIHTDLGLYGIALETGHVDFYPNFGHRPQPGCPNGLLDILSFCAHHMSYIFYAESVKNPDGFISIKCDDDQQFIEGQCLTNDLVPMGYDTPRTARGRFYLQTSPNPPYALGKEGTVFHL